VRPPPGSPSAPLPVSTVPLLGTVLFDRELGSPDGPALDPDLAEQRLGEDSEAEQEDDSGGLTAGATRAAGTLWGLARALLDVDDLLDHRPRGGRLVRLVAQAPVIGVAFGWLDERGGISAAARETTPLLARG
jgi:hypothetical protein